MDVSFRLPPPLMHAGLSMLAPVQRSPLHQQGDTGSTTSSSSPHRVHALPVSGMTRRQCICGLHASLLVWQDEGGKRLGRSSELANAHFVRVVQHNSAVIVGSAQQDAEEDDDEQLTRAVRFISCFMYLCILLHLLLSGPSGVNRAANVLGR